MMFYNITTSSLQNITMDIKDQELEDITRDLNYVRFICLKLIVPIFVAFGVIGNIMNISVLTRRWMKSSTNHYLTALAVCDINYLILAFTLIIIHYDPNLLDSLAYLRYMVHVGTPLVNIYSNTGVWITLTFTIERYIGVCHPMKGKVWCTPQRAKYIIIAVTMTSTLLTLPEFFCSMVNIIVKNNSTLSFRPGPTAFGETSFYTVGITWAHQILFTFTPLILLLIFNSLLIKAVTQATRNRRKMTTVQNERQERHMKEQHKITLMLIAVVIVFLICQLPQAISNLYQAFLKQQGQFTVKVEKKFLIAGNICNLLVMINSSVNFVLYSAFSLKFRRTFRMLFCRCLMQPNRPSTFIFSEVFSQGVDHKYGVRSKGTSSPYASSPIRPATSYVSINGTTPMCSPSPSMGHINSACSKKIAPLSKNGYLTVDAGQGGGNIPKNISCV